MSVDLLCSLNSHAWLRWVSEDHDCGVLIMDAESEVKGAKRRMVNNGTMRVMQADLLYNLKDMQVQYNLNVNIVKPQWFLIHGSQL